MTRWLGLGAVVLIVLGLRCTMRPATPLVDPRDSDTALYQAIVDDMRSGESYYAAAGHELSTRGYATRPLFNWRFPTIAFLEARLPSLAWSRVLLIGLGAVTSLLWILAFRPAGLGNATVVLLAVGAGSPFWGWFSSAGVLHHDVWTGQMIALSLALDATGRRRSSAIAGGAALFIRELALPFVLLMTCRAIVAGRKSESRWWLILLAAFPFALGWHWMHALPYLQPNGLRNSWLALGGWCAVLESTRMNAVLLVLPATALAVVLPLLLFGLWRFPIAFTPAAAVVTIYMALFLAIGRPDNWYWGLLTAPVLPLGLLGLFPGPGRLSSASRVHGPLAVRVP